MGLAFSIVLLVFAFVVHAIMLGHVCRMHNKKYASCPGELHDVVHEYFESHSWHPRIQRMVMQLHDIVPLVILAWLGARAWQSPSFPHIVNSTVFGTAMLLLLKSVFCSVTVLPQANATMYNCKSEKVSLRDMFFGKCGDLIFSMHTAFMLFVALVCAKYGVISTPMAYAVGLVQACLMLAPRGHYTIDVLVGIMAAVFTLQMI